MRYLVDKGYGFIRRGIKERVETKAAHQPALNECFRLT